jgi:cytochrome c oxidase cbb3-type subunit 2
VVLAAVAAGDAVRNPAHGTPAGRGRQVYLAEGCIHCHSQFIRPGPPDEALWGSAEVTRDARSGAPALIGNRRHGPDLATVGARRSAAWLREHFLDPRALVPDSRMPAYPHLFRDSRGADLVEFLLDNSRRTTAPAMPDTAAWRPAPARSADPVEGARAFARWCAVCHGPAGQGDGPLAAKLAKRPANLARGPWLWTRAGDAQETRVARVIKFGIPGTDMPGHETLDDARIADLTQHVLRLRK